MLKSMNHKYKAVSCVMPDHMPFLRTRTSCKLSCKQWIVIEFMTHLASLVVFNW